MDVETIFVDQDTRLAHTAVRVPSAPDPRLAELLGLWRALAEASG